MKISIKTLNYYIFFILLSSCSVQSVLVKAEMNPQALINKNSKIFLYIPQDAPIIDSKIMSHIKDNLLLNNYNIANELKDAELFLSIKTISQSGQTRTVTTTLPINGTWITTSKPVYSNTFIANILVEDILKFNKKEYAKVWSIGIGLDIGEALQPNEEILNKLAEIIVKFIGSDYSGNLDIYINDISGEAQVNY